MIKGLSLDEYKLLSELIVEPLKGMNCKVWIFGSRARGDHIKFSDIDLLFEQSPTEPLKQGCVSNIKEAIENSRLNYKVDLVDITNLAKSYFDGVMAERILL